MSTRCDVDEIVLRIGIERVLTREFEKCFVHVLEVPSVRKLDLVEANFRLGRHRSDVTSDRICQYGIPSPVEQFEAVNDEIGLSA